MASSTAASAVPDVLVVVVALILATQAAPVSPPKDAGSKRALAYLNDALAAGDDADRVRAVLKKWYAPSAFKSYVEQQRNCMAELRVGGPTSPACLGSGLSCSAGTAVVTALAPAGKGTFTAEIVEASGARRALSLTFAGKLVSTIVCTDVSAAAAARTPAHCQGDAGSCDERCGEPGCRTIADHCVGAPLPCAERTSFFTCTGSCTWIPEQ